MKRLKRPRGESKAQEARRRRMGVRKPQGDPIRLGPDGRYVVDYKERFDALTDGPGGEP